MLVPTTCLSCGCSIGHLAPAFAAAREKRVKKAFGAAGTVPEKAAQNMKLSVDCSDLFDKLGVRYDCCRMHLATAMDWRDYY